MVQQNLFYTPLTEQIPLDLNMTTQKIGPKFSMVENNRQADAYDRGTHFTIELYENRIWQTVRTAATEEEARTLSNNFVMETK